MSLRKPKPVPTASKRVLNCSGLRSSSILDWLSLSFEFVHVCVIIFYMLVYLYQHSSRLHTQKQLQYIISGKNESKYLWTINVAVSLLTFSMNSTDLHPLCKVYLTTTAQNKLLLHSHHSVTIIRKAFISQLE